MSEKDDKLREFVVDKIASGLKAETFEKVESWPANVTLQLACQAHASKVLQWYRHRGTRGEDAGLQGSDHCF